MMFLQVILGLILLAVAYVVNQTYGFLVRYYIQTKRRNLGMPPVDIQFPLGIPFARTVLRRLKENTFLNMGQELVDKFGRTVLIERVNLWGIYTIEPENIKTVLATKFADYDLGLRFEQMGPSFGKGIFTLSGEGWKHSRALLRPQFSREQVSQIKSVSHHAETLIKKIERLQKTQEYVDVQELFHELTMDTATEFLFGQSVNSLSGINPVKVTTAAGETIGSAEFVESYSAILKITVKRLVFGNLYWLYNPKEYKYHVDRANAYIDYFVQKALDNTATEEEKQSDFYTFSYELAKVTRDPVVIRSQCFNILIAGRDTTAVTMTMTIYFLSFRPELLASLRAEILEHFPTEHTTFETLRRASLLNQVLKETLRLCPVVPGNTRYAIRDTVLPTGGGSSGKEPVFVPKGSPVFYNVFTMHRDKQLFGDDAHEYRPSRWSEDKARNWEYLPFNGGPRICLGQQFALTEASLTLVHILKRFSRIVPSPTLPAEPEYTTVLTLRAANPVLVRFED